LLFLRGRFALCLAHALENLGKYVMRITEIIEARSHPELNPKTPTFDLLDRYMNNHHHLHFNSMDKVGVNLQSKNTHGPFGVYAFPITFFKDNESMFNRLVNLEKPRQVNVLKARSSINTLDLSQLEVDTMSRIKSAVKSLVPRGLRKDSEIQDFFADIVSDPRRQWGIMTRIIARIARVRGQPTQAIWNSLFRRQGYDAIRDNTMLLNDNPNQTVFLHSRAFDIVETIPLRLRSKSTSPTLSDK
jgi:hypothetical protein